MIVQCHCGKKLRIRDSAAGKKVRCPACKEVFTAEAESDEADENFVAAEDRHADPPLARKKKARRNEDLEGDLEEEADGELDDDDDGHPSRRHKPGTAPKKGVSLARNLIAAAVLVALVAVGAIFVLPKFLTSRGSVVLEINTNDVQIQVDGQKMDYPARPGDTLSVTLELPPGEHELKVTRPGYSTFTRKVNVISDKSQTHFVNLKRI